MSLIISDIFLKFLFVILELLRYNVIVIDMLVIMGILFLLFGLWSFLVFRIRINKLDDKIYNLVKFRDFKTKFLKIVTNFADTKFFVVLAILILLIGRNKMALTIVCLLIIDALIIEILKKIFRRERPNIKRLVYEKGYSFPSGHTTSATCFYGFIIFLVSISGFSLSLKIILGVVLVLFILTIGYSRIYLGVHYFSDVIGGLLVGSLYLITFIYIVFNLLALY